MKNRKGESLRCFLNNLIIKELGGYKSQKITSANITIQLKIRNICLLNRMLNGQLFLKLKNYR